MHAEGFVQEDTQKQWEKLSMHFNKRPPNEILSIYIPVK